MKRQILVIFFSVLCVLIGSTCHYGLMWALDNRDAKKSNRNTRKKLVTSVQNEEMENIHRGQANEEEPEVAIDEFDIQEKQKEVRNLLARGVSFCADNNLVTVCHALTHTKDFIEGELYLFLLDPKGVVYAHGEQSDLLWKNLLDYQDSFGAFIVKSMIKTAQAGPGWVTYEWSGAVKVSFVQKVVIDNKDYIIGCGYYPHSKKYAAIGLVKGAVAMFQQDVAAGRSVEPAFSAMGYPLSNRFLYGDLYLYALDFNGIIRAQGDDPGLIGINSLNYKDAKGKEVNKEIIKKLKEKEIGEGIWVEYISKNAVKVAYAEKVQDDKGNNFFIACGYYPEINRDLTVDLVRRGYQFMKASGTTVAAKEFTDKNINTYRLGDLYLFVYDMKGICVAHGGNSTLVGQNQFDEKDEDGRYYVREIIEQAQSGGGWLDFKLKNSFQATYVEKIDMGVDSYVIGSGLFPVSKPETMTLLVKSAVGYFHSHTEDELFRSLGDRKGNFIRGDLFLFACDFDGYCFAWGSEHEVIWKNILNWQDDEGKQFIKRMIEICSKGPDHFVYKFNKKTRVAYVEQLEKNGKKYIIGSGFYK